MTKYKVEVTFTDSDVVEVVAANEEEAEDKARDCILDLHPCADDVFIENITELKE